MYLGWWVKYRRIALRIVSSLLLRSNEAFSRIQCLRRFAYHSVWCNRRVTKKKIHTSMPLFFSRATFSLKGDSPEINSVNPFFPGCRGQWPRSFRTCFASKQTTFLRVADTPATELFARRSNLSDAHERTALVTSGKDFFQVIVEKVPFFFNFNLNYLSLTVTSFYA